MDNKPVNTTDAVEKNVDNINIKQNYLFAILFITSFAFTILASLLKFVYFKNFPVTIEQPCDSAIDLCFLRDCVEEECLAHELEVYRVATLNASDYAECYTKDGCFEFCNQDETCMISYCEQGSATCTDQDKKNANKADYEEVN